MTACLKTSLFASFIFAVSIVGLKIYIIPTENKSLNPRNTQHLEKQEPHRIYYYESHRKCLEQISYLVEEFRFMCDWNWYDVPIFRDEHDELNAKLAHLENEYHGQLPGVYNRDREIEALRYLHQVFEMAYRLLMTHENFGLLGARDVSYIFLLTAKIMSLLIFNGHSIPSIPQIHAKIALFEEELAVHNEWVLEDKEMPQKLKKIYFEQAIKVRRILDRLGRKAVM